MAYQDMAVEYRGNVGNLYRWFVFEPSPIEAITDPNAVVPRPKEVDFFRYQEGWRCSCSAANQSIDTNICDHSLVVFNYIARTQGPWERDGELMQTAWRVMKREQQGSTKSRRDQEQSIIKLLMELNDQRLSNTFAQQVRDVTEKINDFSRVYSWNTKSVYAGIDPAISDGTAKPAKKPPEQKPEHKEPEEPKKPKSRFSEIDL